MTTTHVDDTLIALDPKLEKKTQLTGKFLDVKVREYENITFLWVTIVTRDDASRLMNQGEYRRKINLVDKLCSYEQFRSRRHEIALLTHIIRH